MNNTVHVNPALGEAREPTRSDRREAAGTQAAALEATQDLGMWHPCLWGHRRQAQPKTQATEGPCPSQSACD